MAGVMPRYAAASVREQPWPVRLTGHEQVRNSLTVYVPSKVMDARAAVGQSHRREALAEGAHWAENFHKIACWRLSDWFRSDFAKSASRRILAAPC